MDGNIQQQPTSLASQTDGKQKSTESSLIPPRFGPSLLRRRATDITPLIPSAISKALLKTNPVPQPITPGLYRSESSQRTKTAQPLRSTKTSQKLVIFPGTTEPPIDNEENPVHDLGLGLRLPLDFHISGSRTIAERMTKDQRDFSNLPRLSAYCTAEGNDMKELCTFLREQHHVSPRFYDECLYARYHFPLMTLRPGGRTNASNVRVRSAPWPGASNFHGGNAIAQSPPAFDQSKYNYEEDHYADDVNDTRYPHHYSTHRHEHEDSARYEAQTLPEYTTKTTNTRVSFDDYSHDISQTTGYDYIPTSAAEEHRTESTHNQSQEYTHVYGSPIDIVDQTGYFVNNENVETPQQTSVATSTTEQPESETLRTPKTPDMNSHFDGGELFVFDYGVIVLWNFSRAQELLLLEDLAPFRIRPLEDSPDDLQAMQIEEMHFQYDTMQAQPRIFNDMITLKSGNHMIKLTISHGVSQSAVLARFEDMMDSTIEDTKHIPKKLAQTGRLDMNRTEITQINGHLFKLRMHVNLVSNILDTPEIFWSEPSLQPLYKAIRDYLEIPQRANILNDRCGVISDLLSMLREHLNNFGVEYQTLIIIYLIIVAVIVACFEIAVKALNQTKTPTASYLS